MKTVFSLVAMCVLASALAMAQGPPAIAINQYQNTSSTGLAGAVTNPASNFIIQVAGGPVYCNGTIQTIGQSTFTLVTNNSYMVVYNCGTQKVYAKLPAVGPGSVTGQPGVPNTVLQPSPVEIALATVVCGSTNCGHTSNGSITDNRSLSAFPAGQYVAGHLNTAAAASDISGTCILGTSCAITFANAFQVAPVCFCTDQTAAAACKSVPLTTGVTLTGTSTDTLAYFCVGNPN